MNRLLPLLLLVLLGCEPQPKVQQPFPTPAPEPATVELADEHTLEGMVQRVPTQVDAIEQRHRSLVEKVVAAEQALLAVDAAILEATTPEQHQELQAKAEELRTAAHALAAEAAELRKEADTLKDTSTRLRAISD
ncbi:MAG: hypothetical protein GY898_12815 [Proteobacteria bacterium]|nr:hypothetical protein [Pseudomonadota bacterium]